MLCQIVEEYLCQRSCHNSSTILLIIPTVQQLLLCRRTEVATELVQYFLSEISRLLLFSVRTLANYTVVMESRRKFPWKNLPLVQFSYIRELEISLKKLLQYLYSPVAYGGPADAKYLCLNRNCHSFIKYCFIKDVKYFIAFRDVSTLVILL